MLQQISHILQHIKTYVATHKTLVETYDHFIVRDISFAAEVSHMLQQILHLCSE